MKKEEFDKIYRLILSKASKVRAEKESEYFSTNDVLRNLRKIASIRSKQTPSTIMDLLAKHIQSLSDFVDHEFGSDRLLEPIDLKLWEEKFVDSLNYIFKLYASVREEKGI